MATVQDNGGDQKYWFSGQPFVGLSRAKFPLDTGGDQKYWFSGQPGFAVLLPTVAGVQTPYAFFALF